MFAFLWLRPTGSSRQWSSDNRFREDLYYRLNVIPINVPPLRQRREDIEVLIDYFLRKHATVGVRQMKLLSDARKVLLDYALAWECSCSSESAIERAMLLAEKEMRLRSKTFL